jgi:2Fe-2S ferredoxin
VSDLIELPKQAYKITFMPMQVSIHVDPADIPYQRDGLPGSILDIALDHDIDIDHACGGVNACSTCHIIVKQGLDSCNESSEEEEDQLDNAPGLEPESRLACQCVPDGSAEILIQIPEWNRNMVKEAPH